MKRKISLILAVLLVCILPMNAAAANETSGSTDVMLPVPFPTSTDTGSGTDSTDEPGEAPSYSYIVNIPANFTITNSSNRFSISASKMDIPAGKEVVVRLDSAATFEADGNFYFYMDGDKSGDHFIQCGIYRENTTHTGNEPVFSSDILASFRSGEYTPHDWADTIMMYFYEDYARAAEGIYRGTIYYTIGLE